MGDKEIGCLEDFFYGKVFINHCGPLFSTPCSILNFDLLNVLYLFRVIRL